MHFFDTSTLFHHSQRVSGLDCQHRLPHCRHQPTNAFFAPSLTTFAAIRAPGGLHQRENGGGTNPADACAPLRSPIMSLQHRSHDCANRFRYVPHCSNLFTPTITQNDAPAACKIAFSVFLNRKGCFIFTQI